MTRLCARCGQPLPRGWILPAHEQCDDWNAWTGGRLSGYSPSSPSAEPYHVSPAAHDAVERLCRYQDDLEVYGRTEEE